jgi:tRNA pseudouridine32 synthase/23S rRNA pseudouridine746 synthase
MAVSKYPSVVTLPDKKKHILIIDFLKERFKGIEPDEWIQRIDKGLVLNAQMEPIRIDSPYEPLSKIYYFKVVESEPAIPFKEKIVFENNNFLIASKPHFLPVIPSGKYLNECLLYKLRETTKNHDLIPANRIDRETAGLVMLIKQKEKRGVYQKLFMDNKVQKEYMAVVNIEAPVKSIKWNVKNRIVKGDPFFRMKSSDGEVNAITEIEVLKEKNDKAILRLKPVTGKKHQLRVHLADCGLPIINDRYYPRLLPELTDFENPLQLLSDKLSFEDPISSILYSFESGRELKETF